ncbi:hypothetical protein [Candidatus Thiosymbion oneisti]|uniref:hypothetical protein n=1 Tax=Candidatus Thiosymbion oneisti TaxID=589554 RepID=UPI000B7CAF7D|nr:hypothetical protein [Candidatus Thiosymbion oneisti]
MRENYIGVNLLFANRQSSALNAILNSYVLNSENYKDTIDETSRIANKVNIFNSEKGLGSMKYLGIEDIFWVIGPLEEGAMLGRMTSWGITFEEAKALSISHESFSFLKKPRSYKEGQFLATPIYYVSDPENPRAISCHMLVECTDLSSVTERAIGLSRSISFLKKIVACDAEGTKLEDLNFVGFEDIALIYQNIRKGGAFIELINDSFASVKDMKHILMTEEQLKDFFRSYPDTP